VILFSLSERSRSTKWGSTPQLSPTTQALTARRRLRPLTDGRFAWSLAGGTQPCRPRATLLRTHGRTHIQVFHTSTSVHMSLSSRPIQSVSRRAVAIYSVTSGDLTRAWFSIMTVKIVRGRRTSRDARRGALRSIGFYHLYVTR